MSPDPSVLLLERLRQAVAPRYAVDRLLASGGMGSVYLATDTSLQRPVAIKLLPPERATADAAMRFLREARTLARLRHPNIVPVHDVKGADETGGLFLYVMDYLEGETLQDRLEQGSMAPEVVVGIAKDLLAALQTAHDHHVVHRDIKPSNIILDQGRAVLVDFGLARLGGETSTVSGEGPRLVGTVAYMAPEQWSQAPVSVATDIYALGLVLYKALTNRTWQPFQPAESFDWSGIDSPLVEALRLATLTDPAERWADVTSFRRALGASGRPSPLRVAAMAGVGVAGLLAMVLLLRPGVPSELALPPFETQPGIDTAIGGSLRWLLYNKLEGVGSLRLVSPQSTRQARRWIRGRVTREGTGIALRLALVVDSVEQWTVVIPSGTDQVAVNESSDRAASEIMIRLFPHELGDYRPGRGFSRNPEAIGEFLDGDIAFRRVLWADAERHLKSALASDSDFAIAAWRLANVQRWRRLTQEVDLGDLCARFCASLRTLDRLLITAHLEPDLPTRLARYREAVDRYPTDAYAALFYGDELLHRGPLAGHSLNEALATFGQAATNDSALAPAWFHIGWAQIRLGHEAPARQALLKLRALVPVGTPGFDVDLTFFLQLAYDWRFHPDRAEAEARRAAGKPDRAPMDQFIRVFRWAMSFDLPVGQVFYARMLRRPEFPQQVRASGESGQGIALIALGRPAAALIHFDSAAALRGTEEAELHRAQWRVIPGALGLFRLDSAEVEAGRQILRSFVSSPSSRERTRARAAWALALDDHALRDGRLRARYQAVVATGARVDPDAGRLLVLLQADSVAATGNYRRALLLSEPLLAVDSAARIGDPFARAVLHWRRGEWLTRLGQGFDADRQWLWYEHADLAGEPTGDVQPVEVDWALGPYARLRRAEGELSRGNRSAACTHLRRLRELWAGAEPALAVQSARLASLGAGCPQ